jgi:hypothetical protein
MATLIVPPLEPVGKEWPTLGPEICGWIEDCLVYGPGDLLGDPYRIEDSFRAWIHRVYEVYPRGHERAGRRRYQLAAKSVRKGLGKTEQAILIALAELSGDAPVRCDGWRREGKTWVPADGGVWTDDALAVEISARKTYADGSNQPGVTITLTAFDAQMALAA